MFKWFKKKEKIRAEICIPKIMIDNNINFDYEYVVENASILISDSSTKRSVIETIQKSSTDFSNQKISSDSNKDIIKVYSLNGMNNEKKLLMAVVDEADTKSEPEPYLLAHKIVQAKNMTAVRNKAVSATY